MIETMANGIGATLMVGAWFWLIWAVVRGDDR